MSHTLSSYRSNSPLTLMTVIIYEDRKRNPNSQNTENRNEETAANHEAELKHHNFYEHLPECEANHISLDNRHMTDNAIYIIVNTIS